MDFIPKKKSYRGFVGPFWNVAKESVLAFINDNALSHGAAIAFYAATSLAPILLIIIAVAGLAIGQEAAKVALSAQISGLMGTQSAELFKAALEGAADQSAGTFAAIIGIITLLATASGVFGEMQLALNVIWRVEPKEMSLSRIVRARAASLGLVAALGFLLLVSLGASAAISALADVLNAYLPFGELIASTINTVVSFIMTAALFAAIYKLLPDRSLQWSDVVFGGLVTAAFFTVGKSLIGWYLGASTTASSYGAAGGLLITLLWVYYSSQIFLLGAEFTRAYSTRHGSRADLRGAVAAPPITSDHTATVPPPVRRPTWPLLLALGSVAAILSGLTAGRRKGSGRSSYR
jgi:membrane protein